VTHTSASYQRYLHFSLSPTCPQFGPPCPVAKVTGNRPIIGRTPSSLLPLWPLYAVSLKYARHVRCHREMSRNVESDCHNNHSSKRAAGGRQWWGAACSGHPVYRSYCSVSDSRSLLSVGICQEKCYSVWQGRVGRAAHSADLEWPAAATSVQCPPSPLVCSFCV